MSPYRVITANQTFKYAQVTFTINNYECHLIEQKPPRWPVRYMGRSDNWLKRFSNECRKTKTKVIILTNHNEDKTQNEPIRNQSKYKQLALSAGKRVRASHDWFWFYAWLVEKVARDFQPIREPSNAKPKQTQHYFRHSIENCCNIYV